MAKKQHGALTPASRRPFDAAGRGNHVLQGFSAVLDEAARLAIVQTTTDRGRVIEQTGGVTPGLYVADGAGGWMFLKPYIAPVFATGVGHTVDQLITVLQGLSIVKQS